MHDLRASAQGGAALRELSVVNHIYISMGDETTCFTQLQKSTGVKKEKKREGGHGEARLAWQVGRGPGARQALRCSGFRSGSKGMLSGVALDGRAGATPHSGMPFGRAMRFGSQSS